MNDKERDSRLPIDCQLAGRDMPGPATPGQPPSEDDVWHAGWDAQRADVRDAALRRIEQLGWALLDRDVAEYGHRRDETVLVAGAVFAGVQALAAIPTRRED